MRLIHFLLYLFKERFKTVPGVRVNLQCLQDFSLYLLKGWCQVWSHCYSSSAVQRISIQQKYPTISTTKTPNKLKVYKNCLEFRRLSCMKIIA